jgi:hypothetical protein
MAFFDLKLIIIIALTFICYFIYKELIVINKKINYIYGRMINVENNQLITSGMSPLNIQKEVNELDNIEKINKGFDNLNTYEKCNISKQVPNQQIISDNIQEHVNLNDFNSLVNQSLNLLNSNKLFNPEMLLTPDILINTTISNSQCPINNLLNTDILSNIGNTQCPINHLFIRKIDIPINRLPDIQEVDNEDTSTYTNLNFEETAINHDLINEVENNDKQVENNDEQVENNNDDEHVEKEEENNNDEQVEVDQRQKNNVQDDENHDSDNNDYSDNNDDNQKVSTTSSIVSNKIVNSPASNKSRSENSQKISPLEEFSNDTSDINKNSNDVNKTIIKLKETSYETILKKLNNYKLPELQDLAIEYKLGLQIGSKNKTKNQLINDIKNFILNKNI